MIETDSVVVKTIIVIPFISNAEYSVSSRVAASTSTVSSLFAKLFTRCYGILLRIWEGSAVAHVVSCFECRMNTDWSSRRAGASIGCEQHKRNELISALSPTCFCEHYAEQRIAKE